MKLITLLGLLPFTLARTFHIATNQNVACLEIKAPTTISLTKTIGTASGENPPVLIFNYDEKLLLPIPNFDYLVTDGKIDDYFNEEGFTFAKGFIGSSYNDILIDKLTYDVTTPGTYCIYSLLIDGYEYRVDVEESSIQFDNVVFCVVNIIVNLFYNQFFSRQNKVLFKLIGKFELTKVGIFAVSLLLSLRFNIINYTEDIVSAVDDVFTMVFLMGYGTLYSSYKDQDIGKIVIVTLFTVTPAIASRFFDLKLDVTNLVINNEYYNVVDGVLGSGKFDGLSVVQRIVRDVKAHRFSAVVAALFGVSKLVKFTMYIATIRQTLNKLTPAGTKSGYIYTVVLWLFVYPFASFAFYPDLVYNYYLVTDYGLVLKQFLLESVRDKYIVLMADECHWVLIFLIWFVGNNGLTVEPTSLKKDE